MEQQLDIQVFRKKVQMTIQGLIRFQVMVHCHLMGYMDGDRKVSPAAIDCATILGVQGTMELSDLCDQAVEYRIFRNKQSVRNALDNMEDKGIVIKETTGADYNRKRIYLNPELGVVNKGNILLEYRLLSLDAS